MLPEELLQFIQQGDQDAFRQFYEFFKARVYNTCMLYLQHEQEAEELTQDVFVEVFHSAASFKGNAAAGTWVYRIAVNKCLDRLRYQKRQKRFAFIASLFHKDTGTLIHDAPDFFHPGVAMEQRENAAILMAAIGQLPESQQTVFILKQLEGLTVREVAQIVGNSEKGVESLLQRAKSGLRILLEQHYHQTKDKD